MKHVIDIKKIYNNFGRKTKTMKSQKGFFVSILSFVLFLFVLMVTYTSGQMNVAAQGQGKPQVVAIQGLAKVEGQDAIVEILVAVQPGENAMAKARDKLRRMYPDAVEIDSSNYSLTGLDWKDDSYFQNNNSQVPFVYNNGNIPAEVNPDGSTVMGKAYQAWNNVVTSIFKFEFDTTSYNGCPSLVKECKGRQYFNGDNEIAWLDIREPSVLGVTWYGTSIEEFDMALDNADFNWYDGINPSDIPNNAIDLQTVWSHELGHALGLGHSNVNGAVMEPYYAGPLRILHQDDIDGITSLYPASNVDLPPTVTITSPADGATFASGANITFAGTADDNEDGDLKTSLNWTDNNIYLGSGSSFPAKLIDGSHKITATVTDSNNSTGSDSVNIEVIVLGDGDPNDIYVGAIDFTEKRKGRGGSFIDLITTVTIHRDSDANGSSAGDELVGGASVQMTLDREGLENPFVFSGTTNSEGIAKFTLQRALIDTPYTATVTGVTHSTYTYNNLLNVENEDSHTIQP